MGYPFLKNIMWDLICGNVNQFEKSLSPLNLFHPVKTILRILTFFVFAQQLDAQQIIHESFKSGVLKENRDIWICLPPKFQAEQEYPILYMMDGQNLLYDSLAYAGTWQIPIKLQELHDGGLDLIIVAVGNAGSGRGRAQEYSWFESKGSPSGNGATFLRFMCEELIPHVEANYQITSGKRGIMGSSLGGLISAEALIEFPDTFQLGGIFSPSFWFNTETMEESYLSRIQPTQKMYLVVGKNEGGEFSMANDQRKVTEILTNYLTPNHLKANVFEDGEHKEWFWAREFVSAVKFLYN